MFSSLFLSEQVIKINKTDNVTKHKIHIIMLFVFVHFPYCFYFLNIGLLTHFNFYLYCCLQKTKLTNQLLIESLI